MSVARARLAELITAFFTRHLAAERNASPHTIASYRDTFRFLLAHVAETTGRQVSQLTVDDFSPDAILRFLEFLEQHRGNSVSTRNARLAAIRSFCVYVASQEPAAAAVAQRILHVPFKKAIGRVVGYLTKDELEAILAQPNRTTPKGRRDYLVLALLYDTCGQCDRTRSEIFSDPEFIQFANEHCVVVIGQDPHDAQDKPHRQGPDGRCTLWPPLTCADHESSFRETADLVGGFRVSPGVYLLTPDASPTDPPEKWILLGEREFPKSGSGVRAYLDGIRQAQEMLGPPR